MEEQGQNADDLALYGQDSNGTVWSICIMNMILHNITRSTIENGDTLEDPLILDNGQIRKFDRVLANPPFSQNYNRAGMKFTSRFREWCPESGKKADLMFVQHMLASLKSNGRMATIMPHGVLFRCGKEKLIRELFINDDCIEAIVSLPPGLFYGTGIPACVLVCNKSKPDALKDKVRFINADREYAEGKNQNRLRPEDIEKIDFVSTLLLNWFRAKGAISAGTVEGFNTKAKLTLRKSYGFRTYRAMEIALYHGLGALPEPRVTHRFC